VVLACRNACRYSCKVLPIVAVFEPEVLTDFTKSPKYEVLKNPFKSFEVLMCRYIDRLTNIRDEANVYFSNIILTVPASRRSWPSLLY
jgi:hypothetical protein